MNAIRANDGVGDRGFTIGEGKTDAIVYLLKPDTPMTKNDASPGLCVKEQFQEIARWTLYA